MAVILVTQITAQELSKKIKSGEKVTIIDVREDDEIAAGKITGVRHIPLGNIPESLNDLNKNEHYYIACHSGNRSSMACEFLTQKGFDVTNMAGGMMSWEDEVEVEK